ncbi:type VI secretion system ImpA family N-terminal domain-containing protein, partial [Photobacterium sanctipauli]
MSDVGNNLEYDHRYLELIDYFEGGNNESMVITEETEDSDLEKQKLVRRYLDEMLKETIDLRLLTYDIVYALINDDVNSAISSTEQLCDMSVQYWDECYPIIS